VDRAEALAWAAAVRSTRDDVVAAVRAGDLSLDAALDRAASDEHVARIRVVHVVEALPGWGKVTSRRALRAIGCADDTPLGSVDRHELTGRFGSPP
jgi:hypothetical protein